MVFIIFQKSRNNACQQKLLKSKLGENWYIFVSSSLPSDEDVH